MRRAETGWEEDAQGAHPSLERACTIYMCAGRGEQKKFRNE